MLRNIVNKVDRSIGGGPRIRDRFPRLNFGTKINDILKHCIFTIFFSCSGECEHRQQGGSIGGGPRIRDRLSKHRIKASGAHHLVFGRPKTRGRWNGIGEYRTKTTMGPNPDWKSHIYWLITGNQILVSQLLRIPGFGILKRRLLRFSYLCITWLISSHFCKGKAWVHYRQ